MRSTGESIERFVENWVQAEWRGDVTELAVLLDEDFIAQAANSPRVRKPEWLRRYQNANLGHTEFNWSTTIAINRTHFCIVMGQLRQTSSFAGRDASATSVATLVVDLAASPRLVALFVDVVSRPKSDIRLQSPHESAVS